jgi:hypothetical protein
MGINACDFKVMLTLKSEFITKRDFAFKQPGSKLVIGKCSRSAKMLIKTTWVETCHWKMFKIGKNTDQNNLGRNLSLSKESCPFENGLEAKRFGSTFEQGCQMVQNDNFGKFWKALVCKTLLYFMTIWYFYCCFDTFYGHVVYVCSCWCTFPHFGLLFA